MMADTQHFCLRWNNYQSSITSAFENLRDDEDFVDVTLACDGKSLKAHRVVLSACSPYFRELLKSTPCKHPVIVLQDVAFSDLHSLVEFIYHGEVNVHQRNLSSFLKTAEVLRVSGLTQQAEDKEDPITQHRPTSKANNLPDDGHFPPPSPPHPPVSSTGGATVNQLLRRAAAMAANNRRERNNSDSSDQSQHSNAGKRARKEEVTDNGEVNSSTTAAQDFSSGNAIKQNASKKVDEPNHRSPSPPNAVKSEPLDLLMAVNDLSDDSMDVTRSTVDPDDPDNRAGGYGRDSAESKLFGTSGGSFNFSMAALAGDPTGLAGLNSHLQGNPDGTPGGSSQGIIHYRMPPPTSGGINEPQECPYCRRTFSCYYSLKRHFQDKHERSDTLYVCEFCQRRYRTKNSLTTHKSLQHRGSSGMLKRLLKNSAIHNVLGQPPAPPN